MQFLLLWYLFSSCKGEHEHKEEQKHDNDHKHKKEWNQEDYKLVKAAVLDYVDGLYLVDSTRIQKSVDPTLRKIGYSANRKGKVFHMTYDQLVSLAARWNKDGKSANEKSPKKIEIYDINSLTASAKLTAAWGIDYFHLSKVDGQWKILNVMWQSLPKKEE